MLCNSRSPLDFGTHLFRHYAFMHVGMEGRRQVDAQPFRGEQVMDSDAEREMDDTLRLAGQTGGTADVVITGYHLPASKHHLMSKTGAPEHTRRVTLPNGRSRSEKARSDRILVASSNLRPRQIPGRLTVAVHITGCGPRWASELNDQYGGGSSGYAEDPRATCAGAPDARTNSLPLLRHPLGEGEFAMENRRLLRLVSTRHWLALLVKLSTRRDIGRKALLAVELIEFAK